MLRRAPLVGRALISMPDPLDVDGRLGIDLAGPLDRLGLRVADRARPIGAALGHGILPVVVPLDVPLIVVLAHYNACSLYLPRSPREGLCLGAPWRSLCLRSSPIVYSSRNLGGG